MLGLLVLYNAEHTQLNTIANDVIQESNLNINYITKENVLMRYAEKLELKTGDFFIADSELDSHDSIYIPSKNSVISAWFNGKLSNTTKQKIDSICSTEQSASDSIYPCRLLLAINSKKHTIDTEATNYANTIHTRVINYFDDTFYAMTLAYLNKNNSSRITLSAQHKNIYISLIYANNYYALVWSDDQLTQHKFKEKGAYTYGMTPLSKNGTLVLHPKFLISKWRKWNTQAITVDKTVNSLRAVSFLENYLERNTVK